MRGRIAQLAMMAASRRSWPLLRRLIPLLVELAQAGGDEDLRQFVVYIAITTRERERWQRFAGAVARQVPGGRELINKTEEMVAVYGDMREQEGELRGKVLTIEGFIGRGIPWSTIEAATGVDQVTFARLKRQMKAADQAT